MDFAGKKIHFMGIGGIGMSALAGIVFAQGAVVSGCDRAENEQTAMLRKMGVSIAIGHDAAHAADCDMLVYTSAVPKDHSELRAAGEKSIKRGKFLAEIMADYKGVGVCGTHGKTSTTWMIAHILLELDKNPTVFLGGVTERLGSNYRCGGEIFVSELDESDGSFLEPELAVGVITNIESEHLAYYGTSEKVVEAFNNFVDNIGTDSLLVLGIDNNYCAEIYERYEGRKEAFGFATGNRGLHVNNYSFSGGVQRADVFYAEHSVGILELSLSGRHNILNALAAVLAVREFGVSFEEALEALKSLRTVQRRMELIRVLNGCSIYSDYAHHPTELKAALDGARELDKTGKIMAVFQPHLYSRTRDYAAEFARELTAADKVVLVELYPAREEPISGVDSGMLVDRLNGLGADVQNSVCRVEDIVATIRENSPEYSTIVCIGAGNIDAEVRKIAE